MQYKLSFMESLDIWNVHDIILKVPEAWMWLTPELALFYKNNTVVIGSLNQYWLRGRCHLEGIFAFLPAGLKHLI